VVAVAILVRTERQPEHKAPRSVAISARDSSPSDELAAINVNWPRTMLTPANVLGLQRTVGNQVTAGLVQRALLKPSEVKNWIRWVRGADRKNSTTFLLTIYNQMRLSVDPRPAEFRSLADARRQLIAAKQIDQEDVDALEEEVDRSVRAGDDPAELVRLRIAAKIESRRAAVEAAFAHHIFQGDMAGNVPTGFHSKADGSATHEAYGARTDVGNKGAYQQSVRLQGRPNVRKPIQSTFFPDGASHEQVIKAVASVYEAGLSTVGYVDPVVNEMRLAKRGDTVFPAGGSDDRTAE
jgi:Bacterial EndoU nuclease